MTEVYKNEKGVTVIPEGNKIVGYKVKKDEQEEAEEGASPEFVHEGMKRPFRLMGSTYKIKPPHHKSALYLTVNDVLMNEGTDHEQAYPYEIFLNSREMESYQWIVTVTRTVSAIFRKGGNITFIVNELERVTQPNGDYWGKDHWHKKGKHYGSVVAEIGYILKQHMVEIGLIDDPLAKLQEMEDKQEEPEKVEVAEPEKPEVENCENPQQDETIDYENDTPPPGYHYMPQIDCEDCDSKWFRMVDGCPRCHEGHSKCG